MNVICQFADVYILYLRTAAFKRVIKCTGFFNGVVVTGDFQ